MRLVINLILIVIIGLLAYTLYFGIKEPIAFKDAVDLRKGAVTERLKQIRFAQEFYRDITGEFSKDFTSLQQVLATDSFTLVKIIGDPDDPNKPFQRIEKKRSAIDSIHYLFTNDDSKIKIELDSLPFVPFGNGEQFEITADTLTYQKTLVNVTKVSTYWKTFMGKKFNDIKYRKYDKNYDPANSIYFGDMLAPNLGGNWE